MMTLEAGLSALVNVLLWPVLALLLMGFAASVVLGGMTLTEALQRKWAKRPSGLRDDPAVSLDALELQVVNQLEPARLLSRLSPMLGLIATMIPLGPALRGVAAGQTQEAMALFSNAFTGVTLALAAAAIGLVVYSVRRRWLLADLLLIRQRRAGAA